MNHQDTKTHVPPLPLETERAAKEVVDAAFKVHQALGPGLLESVYEECLIHEMVKRGLVIRRQVSLVDERLIVELKAVESLLPVHMAQLLTYLKLSDYRLGLRINFNVSLIRDGIRRVIL